MKIYFYSNKDVGDKNVSTVLTIIKKSGVVAITDNNNSSFSLDKIDAFVFCGDNIDTQVSYLIALTLAQSKPVLCLLSKNTKLDPSFEGLTDNSKLFGKMHVYFYTEDDIKDRVVSFLQTIDSASARELFNIKYTLRISSKMADYLNWKAQNDNIKKADWIRDRIQEIAKEDIGYQRFLDNKYK